MYTCSESVSQCINALLQTIKASTHCEEKQKGEIFVGKSKRGNCYEEKQKGEIVAMKIKGGNCSEEKQKGQIVVKKGKKGKLL